MNLGKLLVAGRSIKSGRDYIAYRVNKHVYLPKFGQAQNPFKSPAPAEPAGPGAETAVEPVVKKVMTPVAAKTQKIPTLAPGPVRSTSWASLLNPMSMWRGSQTDEQSTPSPVQSELSLDSVKVVHNDLSDADVEVVPIKSRTADEAAGPAAPSPENAWEFLTERIFRATMD